MIKNTCGLFVISGLMWCLLANPVIASTSTTEGTLGGPCPCGTTGYTCSNNNTCLLENNYACSTSLPTACASGYCQSLNLASDVTAGTCQPPPP